MLKFIVFTVLAISQLGDAAINNRGLQKYLSKGLSKRANDESFKAAYDKAIAEFPEFKYNIVQSEFYNSYGKGQIHITLYSKSSPHGHTIDVDLEGTLKNSTYDVRKQTEIIISPKHVEYTNTTELVAAYLRHQAEYVNVITIHYEKFFGCEFAQYVEIYDHLTGTIAKLVDQLHHYGTLLDNVHIIGFGMSAHVAGGVARMLLPHKVGRITGLDPSGGMFDQTQWLGQLSIDDADFVDIISTNTRKYGTKIERGSVNFYPNGGEIQPESDDLTSHLKAFAYFVESIVSTHSFKSEDAKSWSDYTHGTTLGNTAYMGEYVSKSMRGKFFLNVNPSSPYSKDGKYDLTLKDQAIRRGRVFEMTQKALMKDSAQFENTFDREVAAYNAEDARTENPPARRVYDYVRRTSDQAEMKSE